MREISSDDIEALAVGAWILGTGGGGSPYHALLYLRRVYAEGKRAQLIDPDELDDAANVAVVSMMGAPLVAQERLVDGREMKRAVEALQDFTGRKFDAVMALEIGGGNGMQPIIAAIHLGIPVVDADTMGRAYPEAQMTSFAVGDLWPAPLSTVEPRGNEAIVSRVTSWKWMERASRKLCTEFGSLASTCKAPPGCPGAALSGMVTGARLSSSGTGSDTVWVRGWRRQSGFGFVRLCSLNSRTDIGGSVT